MMIMLLRFLKGMMAAVEMSGRNAACSCRSGPTGRKRERMVELGNVRFPPALKEQESRPSSYGTMVQSRV
jgi:hypothetical protein